MTTVRVSTPSRLHFGLLRVHESSQLGYGGLGMMVDGPRTAICASPAREWTVVGPDATRARRAALAALRAAAWPDKPPALAVRVDAATPAHCGLGSGTQLSLAIAAAVRALAGQSPGTANELAAAVGRGARSGIGSHGFVHGGLLWERGRDAGAALCPLAERVATPPSWRIVLVLPREAQGLSGDDEQRAFAALPAVPDSVTERLQQLAEGAILPAARDAQIEAFGEAVYEYGRLSGECFARIQGGPYASPEIAMRVAELRGWGVRGVGQSSWGPTVFAIVETAEAAAALRRQAASRWPDCDILVAGPDNHGAVIE
jgi:beta-RFAP synthase